MERVPKQEQFVTNSEEWDHLEEINESSDNWKQLKEGSPLDAEELLTDIDGFTDMSVGEQIAELQMLLERMQDNNEKRFVAEELAKRLTATKATKVYLETMNRVGIAPDGSNRSVAA